MECKMRERSNALYYVFAFLGGCVLLFIIAPLIGMLLKCSPRVLAETAGDREVQKSIGLTLWTSMAATILMALGGIPLAYILARKKFPLKGLIMGIVDIPVAIPHSAAGIAVLGILARESLMGKAAKGLGFRFVSHPAGIIAAMAFVSVPYLINAAHDGFRSVPRRLEKAALNLGASPARVFFTISLPLAWRSILSGLILMWARGMSEFGAVIVIAYHPMITPVMIYERFGSFGLKYSRPVAVLFILVCLVFFSIFRLLVRKKEDAQD